MTGNVLKAYAPLPLLLSLTLLSSIVLAVGIGSVTIPARVVAELLLDRLPLLEFAETGTRTSSVILFDIRMPRVALMAQPAKALVTAGAAKQGLFRNPLADPYLVGVASGAGLGATLAIAGGLDATAIGMSTVPLAAFVGGVLTVGVVVMAARVGKTTPVTTMLLAGVAVGAFATAVTTFLMLRRLDGLQRAFNWMLGGYSAGGWRPVLTMLPYLLLGAVTLQLHARALNVFQLGEEQAQQLGVNVEFLKMLLVSAATLMTAAAVAFGGLIGFVGLIVPHAPRMLGGPDYRRLLPLCMLGGAAFLVLCDLAARTLLAPRELPVGVITALTGTPFFIFLLRRLKRSVF
jgi:iron complex transport system permease protein